VPDPDDPLRPASLVIGGAPPAPLVVVATLLDPLDDAPLDDVLLDDVPLVPVEPGVPTALPPVEPEVPTDTDDDAGPDVEPLVGPPPLPPFESG
jgi:hypothetical protein